MSATRPTLDKEEVVRIGKEFYANRVAPQLQPGDHGKFVAIDVPSGEFEIDNSDMAAIERLKERVGGVPTIYLERVGHKSPYRLRPRGLR